MIRKSLLLTIYSILSVVVMGQSNYPPVTNYSTHDYSKNYNPENYCVVQDFRGVMYFGNGNGVLEFDGAQWRYINVQPGAFVRSLAIDSTGRIYAGSFGEFGYFKANDKGELEFNSLLSKLNEEDQFFSDIWSIHATQNEVYFQAQEVLFVLDLATDQIEVVYPTDMSSFHTSFLVDGELYLRAREIGIVKYNNGDLERLKGTEIFRGLGVFGIHKTAGDSLLIITQELGLWKYKDQFIRELNPEQTPYFNSLGIFGSTELSNGLIALNTFTDGVFIIDQDASIQQELNRRVGLRSNDVKYVYEDRDKNIWMALENGISKVNYNSPLSYFNETSGIEGNVQCMIRFQDKMYVGTSYGLFKETDAQNESKSFENTKLVKDQVWDFEVVGNQLFIATSKGIYRGDGAGYSKVSDNRSNVIKYLADRKLFISAGPTGIYVYSRSFGTIWKKENNYSTFLGVEVDPNYKQTVWLGTSNSGVFRLQYKNDGFVLDEYGMFDGLVDNELGNPILADGQVKFGTTQGILAFIHEDIMVQELDDSLKDDPDYYRGMFQTDFLHDSSFTSKILLVQEAEDRTWFCAEDKIGFYDYSSKEFVNKPFWGVDFGRVNEFYLEQNGILWIGCADGLIRFEENSRKDYQSPFDALIRSFQVGRDSIVYNGASVDSVVTNPVLEYVKNDVQFTFAAPYFEDNHLPEFSFMLEGHDDEWTLWSDKTEANFTNLSEGVYTFKVKARNIYGVVSSEASYTFEILPPWYRTTWAYVLYGIIVIVLFFVGFRLFSARLKQKNIWLEGVVAERTKEISEKNEVLKLQKEEIEDSINYAQRIQEALLPLEQEMKKWVPDSFVLFRPKDIVSGDFYWFTEVDNKLVFVCADCTGHGVPGAFMSMIGSDRLNIIVEERRITNPGLILSELNKAIKKSLKQDGQKDSTKDGMDAAICTIDLNTNELHYSGANRPLWIIQNGEIQEIKATKVAVAGFTPDEQVFEEHIIPLSSDLKFYMSSDGYADQFGGIKGKKLKVKTMKQIILDHCNSDFTTQKNVLHDHLIEWMGDHEQIDDVCVVGFQIKG